MIVDTGILFALADRDDRHHRAAKAIFTLPEPRIVPEPVVVETDWMVLRHLGVDAEIAFLRGLSTEAFAVECPTIADRERAGQLVEQYRDLEIGYVDAITVALAERFRDDRIATVGRRDFAAIKPAHVETFDLLP